MNEDQFLSAARKAAADIKLIYMLTHKISVLNQTVDYFKHIIMLEKSEHKTIYGAYKSFCELNSHSSMDSMQFAIIAYVELENQAERYNLIKRSEENAKDPQPLFKGGPKPDEL